MLGNNPKKVKNVMRTRVTRLLESLRNETNQNKLDEIATELDQILIGQIEKTQKLVKLSAVNEKDDFEIPKGLEKMWKQVKITPRAAKSISVLPRSINSMKNLRGLRMIRKEKPGQIDLTNVNQFIEMQKELEHFSKPRFGDKVEDEECEEHAYARACGCKKRQHEQSLQEQHTQMYQYYRKDPNVKWPVVSLEKTKQSLELRSAKIRRSLERNSNKSISPRFRAVEKSLDYSDVVYSRKTNDLPYKVTEHYESILNTMENPNQTQLSIASLDDHSRSFRLPVI